MGHTQGSEPDDRHLPQGRGPKSGAEGSKFEPIQFTLQWKLFRHFFTLFSTSYDLSITQSNPVLGERGRRTRQCNKWRSTVLPGIGESERIYRQDSGSNYHYIV